MPRADARLLAIEELISRWGRWAAGRLCDGDRYGDPSCTFGGSGSWDGDGAGFISGTGSGALVIGCVF